MPYADPTDLDSHIADILNAATTWAGAIASGIRSAPAIANARQQAALEVLGAISENPEHGYYGELSELVSVVHNSFLPAHDGQIGVPKIVPFAGATARDGFPARADQIDSFRDNPAAYTGSLDGIVTAHDQPTATRVEGAIIDSVLSAVGANYVVGDTGTINTGDGLATYEVLTVDIDGGVTTYELNLRGSGYAVSQGVTTAVGGAQPGIGTGFAIDIMAIGSTGSGKRSPLSCHFSIVSSYFKFTGLSAQIPMIIISETMRDTQIPLRLGPTVVKRAIPKLVKPGDPLFLISREYEIDGKQDLVEIVGGAMKVRPVRAVPEIVDSLKRN